MIKLTAEGQSVPLLITYGMNLFSHDMAKFKYEKE